MNFDKNENQKMIAQMVRDFAEKEIKPYFMDWDESQEFPVHVFKKLGELGLMGVFIPETYGGSGFGYFEYITVIEEIAKVCGSVGLSVAAHNSLCTGHIYYHGSEEQKKKYLPKLASAEWIGAWGLTETGTGSDSGRMNTTAVLDGDQWVLNGSKNFITHGKSAETCELIFDNCRIPKENIIGEIGHGFKQAMQILDGGRISIGALSLGIAKGAYEAAVQYAKEREQFGQSISKFQAIGFKLADMATEIEAAELLLYQAAYLKNNKRPMTKESAIAKYYASEVACRVANEAVQIFGGYGYTKDFPVEKFYRDAKLCTIGEGTSEIQKLVISREILK